MKMVQRKAFFLFWKQACNISRKIPHFSTLFKLDLSSKNGHIPRLLHFAHELQRPRTSAFKRAASTNYGKIWRHPLLGLKVVGKKRWREKGEIYKEPFSKWFILACNISLSFQNAFDFKQLLDEVFVISGIIKVEVVAISRGRRLRLITLTETLIIPESQKPNLITVLLYIVLKKITTNPLSHRTQFIFDKPCSYVNLTLLLEIMHCARNLRIIH